MGGGGGSSGPTVQQQQLQTEQALTTANLNLEENSQRKTILNAMQGTRVFRGSALSRALAGNTDGSGAATGGPASAAQTNPSVIAPAATSILDSTNRGGSQSAGAIAVTAAAAQANAANRGGLTPPRSQVKAGGGAA